jgi:signal transduction histidine kinase
MPPEAAAEQQVYLQQGNQSLIFVPMIEEGRTIGLLGFDSVRRERHWSDETITLLKIVCQIVVNALQRKKTDEALRKSERSLKQRVEERTQELSTLLTVQQALTSSLDTDAVLQMITREARRLTGATFSAVFLREGDTLCLSMSEGNPPPDMQVGYRMPLEGSATGLAITSGQPIRIDDAPADTRINAKAVQLAKIRSLLIAPLLSHTCSIGAISVGNQQPAMFTAEDERLLTMLTPAAVIALENARFYREEQQRRRELEALYRADEQLYRYLHLDQVLHALVDVAVDILHADKSSLLVWEEQKLVVRAARGFVTKDVDQISQAATSGYARQVISSGKPVVIENACHDGHIAQFLVDVEGICSFMHVPVTVGEQVFGVFNVNYTYPRTFSDQEQRLIIALAQRAGLAIENARLYGQAQQVAAMEERQRLARELHDAVTQTLFSASMIADVLPQVWERKPTEAKTRLAQLRQLTRGALAEMRSLLLELRPAALLEANLADLLKQLAEATSGRAQMSLSVNVTIQGTCTVSDDEKVALYRITQEALNNIIKHASASQGNITLQSNDQQVTLEICDNGCGFAAEDVAAGRFGQRIMRERATAIGATLHVDSRPGQGTSILVVLPYANRQNREGKTP